MAKKQKPDIYEMILYYCPHCGKLTLHDIEMIRVSDIWVCPYCGIDITIEG